MTREEKIEVIKKTEIFKNLTEDDFLHIAQVAKDQSFKKGDIIFEENSMADAFYIIASGEVEILKEMEKGPQEILATKKSYDVFGEMAVIDDLPRSATIRAKSDIVLLKLSKDIFNELLKSFSHVSLEIARSICSTVRKANINYINDLEKRNKQLNYAYKKLKEAQNELIRLEKLSAVGKFASLIIHDIKSPMSNIKLYAEAIDKKSDKNDKIHESAKLIKDEVDRLNNMVTEVLEFSRGEININKTPVNFGAFILTMIDAVKDDLLKSDVSIIYNEKTSSVIMIDIEKMKRVFYNLFNNARDAILSKGKIIIKTVEDGNWLKWTFQDNGIGMDDDILQKIFDPFFSYNKKKGTGLGMTIVKSVIESHEGFIKAYSKKNFGTKFIIFLPNDK